MPLSAPLKTQLQTSHLHLADLWPHPEKREARNWPSLTIALPNGAKLEGSLSKEQIGARLSLAEEFFLAARSALSRHPAFASLMKAETFREARLIPALQTVVLRVESFNTDTKRITVTQDDIDMDDFAGRTANILVKHFDNVLRNAGLLEM